jgi:cytochrome c oxidase subunit II
MAPFIQSVLHPAGLQAVRLNHLWWVMFWVCTVVFLCIVAAVALAIVFGRRARPAPSDAMLSGTVAAAVGVSIVALLVLLTASEITGRDLEALKSQDALRIQITGNQWWWDIQYLNPNPSLRVTTANEIHVPVGRPVGLVLRSTDVIHSLWIPALHGKRDLLPGRQNEIWIQADQAGFYRGQCAEYCGMQHAKMALSVVADTSDDFERWLSHMRSTAPAPTTPSEVRGRDVVERGPCAMCHTISGTLAAGRTAPDLTHIASRSTIGAGSVPNSRGNLAGWIADPQHIKPGNKMPATGLTSEELLAVLDYLETLK